MFTKRLRTEKYILALNKKSTNGVIIQMIKTKIATLLIICISIMLCVNITAFADEENYSKDNIKNNEWSYMERREDIPSREEIGLIPKDAPQLWREEELQTMGINYTDEFGNPIRQYNSYIGIISENGLRLENNLNRRISYRGF